MAASAPLPSAIVAQSDLLASPLPNGPCNFRRLDLSEAPVCGCRRFWLDEPVSRYQSGHNGDTSTRCYCGHHACFHDSVAFTHGSAAGVSLTTPSCLPFQPKQETFMGVLVPKHDNSHAQSVYSLSDTIPDPCSPRRPELCTPRGSDFDTADRASQHQTRPFSGGVITSHDSVGILTRLPDTYRDVCTIPSGAFESTAGRICVSAPELLCGKGSAQSATEVNTPSVLGPPSAEMPHVGSASESHNAQCVRVLGDVPGTNSSRERREASEAAGEIGPCTSSQRGPWLSNDLENILRGYARRLDTLETLSFSQVPVEEVQEKFELLDGRLLDLEVWRAELPTQTHAKDVSTSQGGDSDGNDASNHSLNVEMAGVTEASQRMDDMEDRLVHLEKAYPSYAYPWELEIILLPWGRNLRGIWDIPPSGILSQQPRSSGPERWRDALSHDDFSGQSRSMKENGSLLYSPHVDSNRVAWKYAKAPGPNGPVSRRLGSRGLVRKVTITECGAYHIWTTIVGAFESFLQDYTIHRAQWTPSCDKFQGLLQALVPLRKVRKCSWLQFLEPHEMVTPTTWSFNYLNSGVIMKAKGGIRRLYVTTPDAYIQAEAGISWLQIFGLPCPSDTTQSEDIAQDDEEVDRPLEEQCWNHIPSLDSMPCSDVSSPFGSDDEYTKSKEDGDGAYSDDKGISATPVPLPSSSIPAPDTTAARQGRGASNRMSSSPPPLKRSVASYEDPVVFQKRRRVSRSPFAWRQLRGITPRMSREPSLPITPQYEWNGRSSQPHPTVHRATSYSQHAYATPHSTSMAMYYDGVGSDTEADSDMKSVINESLSESEKEWQGVTDDDRSESRQRGDVGMQECEYSDMSMGEGDMTDVSSSSMHRSTRYSADGESDKENDVSFDRSFVYEDDGEV